MRNFDRIAIFQAFHPLQVHTLNMAISLSEAGYNIDLFLFKCDSKYIKGKEQNIHIYDFSGLSKSWNTNDRLYQKILSAARFFFIEPIFLSKNKLFPKRLIKRSEEIISANEYKCFIGVEKMGLVWSGILAIEFNIPFLYYSLELYDLAFAFHLRGKLPLLKAIRYIREKLLESKYHRKATATIIQDENRAKEIMCYNKVPSMKSIYLPVSLPGKPIYNKSNFLRDKMSILNDKLIILQFGLIEKNRLVLEIAKEAQNFPDDWMLVFHGPIIDYKILNEIKKVDNRKRIVISEILLPVDKINELVSSADIGFCFYGNKSANDLHAGFSSEKLARYLQNGIPIVAFNYPTFEDSIGRTNSGVCISDLSQLAAAIRKIQNNYFEYRRNAFIAFSRYFEYSNQFHKVQEYIEAL